MENEAMNVADGGGEPAAAGVTLHEGRLAGDVFYRHWAPESPRAVILLAHGLGEHSGRYREFAEFCAARQVAVLAPDHPGHGESPGTRAHIARFSDFFPPLTELRALIERSYPGLPVFLVGHSMGGLIAVRYLLENQSQFAGAALSGAALEVPEAPSAVAIFINRLIAALLPKLGVMQLDATQVSRDPAVVEAYQNDPLVHSGKISARLVTELFATMAEVAARRGEITLPLLVLHGDGDVMTAAEGSRHFVEAAGSSDKSLKIYPGLYHEIFNEPEKLEVMGDLCAWLTARCPAPDSA